MIPFCVTWLKTQNNNYLYSYTKTLVPNLSQNFHKGKAPIIT